MFIQAKFHDIDEELDDKQIPWEPVLKALKDAGYTGYLSSEYEGEREPWRSIEQVRRQHSLMRQIADASERAHPATALKEPPMPNGLITTTAFARIPRGSRCALTLPWYRSLWLSAVTTLQVSIDGEEVAATTSCRAGWRAVRARRAAGAERGALVPAVAPAADRPRDDRSVSAKPTRSCISVSCGCRICRSFRGRTAARGCTCRTSCTRSTLTVADADAAPRRS